MTPLLDRCFIPASSEARLSGRGAEPDERSESDEAGWWISDSQGPCHPERSEGTNQKTFKHCI